MVVNHHLLAADLAVRQASDNWEEAAVLPPYQRLVLDEAHHLEDVAASHLGRAGDAAAACAGCSAGSSATAAAWCPTLAHELRGRGDLLSRASLDLLRERLLPALGDARRASEAMFLRLYERLAEAPARRSSGSSDEFATDPIWERGPGARAATRRCAPSARCGTRWRRSPTG